MVDMEINNFADYSKGLADAWKYFDKRHLLDKRKDTGFDPQKDFGGEGSVWQDEAKKQKKLFRISIGSTDNQEVEG